MRKPSFSLKPLRRLQWRLTFSYTLVTVAALVAVELLLFGALLALLGSDFLVNNVAAAMQNAFVPQVRPYLESNPPDVAGLNEWMQVLGQQESVSLENQQNPRLTRGLSIEFDQQQRYLVLDAEGRLLAQMPLPDDTAVELGQPFDVTQLDGLSQLLPAAYAGDDNMANLYTSLPDGTLVMALPIEGEAGKMLGIFVFVSVMPGLNWATLRPLLLVILYSVIPFTLAAGLIGSVFGFLTARGLSRRLGVLSQAADAWSRGDFSAVAADSSGDELGQLARRLNRMAEQLENLLHTRQELATLEERNRLARDLHDSVKQQLFATAMQVAAARALLPADPEAVGQHLAEAEQLARQSQQELTGLLQELRPATLDGKGLVEALRTYTAEWSRRTNIPAQVRLQGERPLPLEVEQALFRVAQEALANVTRHSLAKMADVHLAWQNGDVILTVADDGRGFEPAGSGQRGVGLHSMQERVEALGGRFQVDSQPGKGTNVIATVPLALEGRGVRGEG
jgi:NarL family two-component system sensor histidine kinase LiaS